MRTVPKLGIQCHVGLPKVCGPDSIRIQNYSQKPGMSLDFTGLACILKCNYGQDNLGWFGFATFCFEARICMAWMGHFLENNIDDATYPSLASVKVCVRLGLVRRSSFAWGA